MSLPLWADVQHHPCNACILPQVGQTSPQVARLLSHSSSAVISSNSFTGLGEKSSKAF
jgi:hypothetical protein